MSEPTVDETTDEPDDPTQLILPHIESGMRVCGCRARNLWYATPGLGLAGAGVTAALFGDVSTALPLVGSGAPLAAGGFAFAETSGEHTTGLDRLRAPVRARRQQREMPKLYDELANAPVHGVRRVSSEGFVEMDDGRLVAFIRLHGRNTDLETPSERQRMVSSLSGRADERIGDYDFRYYSTTQRFDPDEVADRFRDAAVAPSYTGERWRAARAVLRDVAEWHESTESERWDARRWCHYAIVGVEPWEAAPQRDDDSGLFTGLVDQLTGSSDDGHGPTDRERLRARMKRELRKRVATLAGQVFGPTTGVETEQAGGGEVAALLASYWTGSAGGFDSETPPDAEDEERLAEALSAPEYDFSGDYVRVGRQYARTYWVADWPAHPPASFLREVVTQRGVDVDVTVRFGDTNRENTKAKLDDKTSEVRADLKEREEESDLSTLGDEGDMDDYLRAYLLLHGRETRAWAVNAYVTVRAGTRAALDSAEKALVDDLEDEASVTLDVERARALEDRADTLQSTAEEPPADLTLVSPEPRARDLFESGSPVGRDVYRRVSNRSRDRLALGGAVGALFPAVSAVYDHADGIGWGRSRQNGSEILADPFDVGGPAHGLFIGDSGSGKTYSVVLRALRWWLADPDRTLVLAGPFGDLTGLVDAFDGERLVIGGSQTINPLAISPGDGADGADAVHQKVREVTAFLSGVLREAGVDPGDYTTDMKAAAYETYARAGIEPEKPERLHREAPTMADYREVLGDIAERPGEEAYSTSDVEVDLVEESAAQLLRQLSGFQAGREYDYFTGSNEFDIEAGGLSYIDLQQLESLGKVGKSAALQTVLSRVYESVKSADETLFLLDEAHYLLHNEETLEWLQRATRHWRHHDGGLWLSSQRAQDFVDATDGSGDGHLETIRTQCSIKQITDLDGVDETVADSHAFDLNDKQVNFLDDHAMRGDAFQKTDQQGYSDALLSFKDMEGWLRVQVRASPLEHELLTHDPDEDPPIGEYLAARGFDVAPSAD